jgi:putative glutamine amidotransferase
MALPIVGVTTGRRNNRPLRNELQTSTMGCDIRYPQAVARSGGAPILLPRIAEAEVIESAMERVDALMLTGGGDVVSLAYGEQPHPKSHYQDPVRDAVEFEAVRIAMGRQMPILAICRGIQSLNVALGGTLVQDIPSQVEDDILHYSHAAETVLVHTIDIEAGSLLARVLGTTSTPVSSWHHQAVKEPGEGLRVSARAPDGVVEGLEAADGRPVLAVQCHPEDSAEDYPLFQKLFDWVVEQAAQSRGS